MTNYSIEPKDCVFVKGYRFLSFAKNVDKKVGKSISKNGSGKYSQKFLEHAKQSATNAVTISKRVIQKTAKATVDLIANKTLDMVAKSSVDKITKILRTLPQNTSETEDIGFDAEIPIER